MKTSWWSIRACFAGLLGLMLAGLAPSRAATFSDETWVSMGGLAGPDNSVRVIAVDGGDLYIGGDFTKVGTVNASRVAKWNGSSWSTLGSGLNGTVHALAVSGSDLYVGGAFTAAGGVANTGRIAKWNGGTWSALGTGMNGMVYALAVSGANLYAGGAFTLADGVANTARIAKWNGSAWSALGTGMSGNVLALAVSGGDVYAGGAFALAGGVANTARIAKWNGSAWLPLATGFSSGQVNALVISSGDLYVGGSFANPKVRKWSGVAWSSLTGINATVYSLAVDGDGRVYAGVGPSAGTLNMYESGTWYQWPGAFNSSGNGYAVTYTGGKIYLGGDFSIPVSCFARLDDLTLWSANADSVAADWSGVGTVSTDGPVYAVAISGSNVFLGGAFNVAGGATATNIARWNGSSFSALGTGLDQQVNALAISGGDLYAGGAFVTAGGTAASKVARWNGSAWSALGSGVAGAGYFAVNALAVGTNGDLFAGGRFTTAGGTAAINIAKWNGSAWSAVGSGLGGNVFGDDVWSLLCSGSDLYAGGSFDGPPGAPNTLKYIAKWNGSTWSGLGSGMARASGEDVRIYALAFTGGNLYAGGAFTNAGGNAANRIAKWDGSAWSPLGAGLSAPVYALVVSGGDLYAGGSFTTAGGASANYVSKWNGSTWSTLGSGTDGAVNALAVDGMDGLFLGGSFNGAGLTLSPYAIYAKPPARGTVIRLR